ncbi:MAG: haloacid dehalogenase-like hydrolase, partial [Oscillatoria sp. PMC 1076.18]|nr:haloacid dehalogenase-like hydrolase [Oscillatoria sp. PMC 1076.18]
MTFATKTLSKRIAVIFDFDDTLVPDTFDILIESLGLDAHTFREERVKPLIESGWDKIPARFYSLIAESKQRNNPEEKITQEYLAKFGQELEPFPGVTEMFSDLQKRADELVPGIEVEFYIITSGFLEIARNSKIASHFTAMWGCDFSYHETGEVEFLKKMISYTEKTRYLYQISRGTKQAKKTEENLLFVYQDVPEEELYIPFSQMIYLGDGTSDLPCFAVMNQEQGMALGVYKGDSVEEWKDDIKVSRSQRIANLAPADYREGSELRTSLILAVEAIC